MWMMQQVKQQRRSVPWPMGVKAAKKPGPVKVKDDGDRDPIILKTAIKHKFFGSLLMIDRQVFVRGLVKGIHRIEIDVNQKLRIDRKKIELSEPEVYKIKAHFFKIKKDHANAGKVKKSPGSRP